MLKDPFALLVIAIGAAMNALVGSVVQLLKLPVYLDLVGSILVAALLGTLPGVIAAALGTALLTAFTSVASLYYVFTAIAVTGAASIFTRYGYLSGIWPTVLFGIFLGVISAFASAPITTYFFSGISFVGADAFTAFFQHLGKNLSTSVILGGLATDPVDKLITSLICFSLIQSLPQTLRRRFPRLRRK